MTALHISLGHNSSAALVSDGRLVRAYEQERIDRVKSSSAYPRDAIACALGGRTRVDTAFVSHWFDDTTLTSNKYLDFEHLKAIARDVVSVSKELTHHDLHAMSAVSFLRSDCVSESASVVVLDGFGTSQECFSAYHVQAALYARPQLTYRVFGYQNSLGLMYQYATEYLGLKPNQDEYKLLGYESRVLTYLSPDKAHSMRSIVSAQARTHAIAMLRATTAPAASGGLIDYDELKRARAKWWACADGWRAMCGVTSDAGVKACVAFCAQTFIEVCVEQLIKATLGAPAHTLILTGGCFYNVKLNRVVQTTCQSKRRVFAHPLAGDQGAALGFTPAVSCRNLEMGARSLGITKQSTPGVYVFDNDYDWVSVAAEMLEEGRIVNVVRGWMEYGPRALCNTTTFARPTKANVRAINQLNNRDDAMPMAPVMTRDAANTWLDANELRRSEPSLGYMITTIAFTRLPVSLLGVAHKDPLEDVWTARPQVVDHPGPIRRLLDMTPDGTLINTSFNYHGEPIVYSENDARATHIKQRLRAGHLRIDAPITIIIKTP